MQMCLNLISASTFNQWTAATKKKKKAGGWGGQLNCNLLHLSIINLLELLLGAN